MLSRIKIVIALWLLGDAVHRISPNDIKGLPVWFIDTQRIDLAEFPTNIGHVIEVKCAGKSPKECFAVIGIPDHLGL